ncbi:hypothetical protein KI387_012180, partial [Taxus chinensis]
SEPKLAKYGGASSTNGAEQHQERLEIDSIISNQGAQSFILRIRFNLRPEPPKSSLSILPEGEKWMIIKKMETSKWKCSVQIPVVAPLESVWEIMSNFYGFQKWFPGLKSCERVEGALDIRVGCIHYGTDPFSSDGKESWATNKLIAFDGTNHSYTYVVTDTNIDGFENYQANFQVVEGGEQKKGDCLIKWKCQLQELLPGHSEQDILEFYSSTLSNMAQKLEQLASSQKHSIVE